MLTIRGVAPKNAPPTETRFPFAGSGKLEQVGVIAGRAQARFGHFQAKALRERGCVHFVHFAAAGGLQEILSERRA